MNTKYSNQLFLGNTISQEPVVIDFKELANSHMLVTGMSGVGKTYGLQVFSERIFQNGSAVTILDYSGSYLLDQLEPWFIQGTLGSLQIINAYKDGIQLNLFNPLQLEKDLLEKNCDTAKRVSELFSQALKLGSKQQNVLYKGIRQMQEDMISKNNHCLDYLLNILQSFGRESTSLLQKLLPILEQKVLNSSSQHINFCTPSEIRIINLQHFSLENQRILSDIILWEIWNQSVANKTSERRVTVVLDEAQLLNLSANSPVTKILTEGRKYGIGIWLATQFIHDNFSSDVTHRLSQAATRIYFRPDEKELPYTSKDIDSQEKGWYLILKNLGRGDCVVKYTANTPYSVKEYKVKIHISI